MRGNDSPRCDFNMFFFWSQVLLNQIGFLKKSLPLRDISYVGDCGPAVVVAGSAALYLHMIERRILPRWDPNDLDVFVTGSMARRASKFRSYVNRFVNMVELSSFTLEEVEEHFNYYCLRDHKVLIINVKVKEFGIPFSFVQCPHLKDGTEVVDTFDINIVKVWIQIDTVRIVMNPEVYHCIAAKIAKVEDVVWSDVVPSRFDRAKLTSTLRRMEKYRKRGFRFLDTPLIMTEDDAENRVDSDVD